MSWVRGAEAGGVRVEGWSGSEAEVSCCLRKEVVFVWYLCGGSLGGNEGIGWPQYGSGWSFQGNVKSVMAIL